MASVPLNHLLKIGSDALQTTAQNLCAAVNELLGKFDTWTSAVTASTSGSNVVAVFDNLNNSYGYKLYCEDTLVGVKSMTKGTGTTSGTIKLTFVLKGATSGTTQCYLRILK